MIFPSKIKTVLDIAQRNSQSLLVVINDLLDVEKLTAGKMDYYFENVEIYKIIADTVKDIEGYAENHNVKIIYNQNLRKKIFVKADRMRLMQVITNLLSNAIKFTENDKDVEIVVRNQPNNKIRVSVINYGSEIPKEYRNKIFGRFIQVDSSESRKKSGTGLGLSIVRQIVKDMKGRIDFTSKKEKPYFL